MDRYICFKASDGSKVSSSDNGNSKWSLNNGSYSDHLNADQNVALNWGASASTGYIARGCSGFMDYTQCTLSSSGTFGNGGVTNYGRLQNTYPNHANYQGHWRFYAFPVNSYQVIVAAGMNMPSPSRPAVSVAYINSVSSGSLTDALWKTDHGLNLEDMQYSWEDSRLYASMHRRTSTSNYKKHAVFTRAQFTNSTKSFDWAKGVEVQVNGSTVNATGGRIFIKDGKFYAAIIVEEGWGNPLLMVWDSVNGPTNGTYGEGTTGTYDTQIIIYTVGGSHGWVSASNGNQYFGNGGTASKVNRTAWGQNYNANTFTESDDSGTTDASYVPQKLIDGNYDSNAAYEGFNKGATDRVIDQES
jgi:hypothetical protein